jgi:hypothetical protein
MLASFLLLLAQLLPPVCETSYEKADRGLSDSVPHYKVTYLPHNDFTVNADLNDKSWQSCNVINSISDPWDKDATGTTEFRAAYDEHFFYFSFRVKDNIVRYENENSEFSVAKGDRVELFFSADDSLKNYYCMEMAPNAHVLDYKATYHRIFDSKWNLKAATVKGKTDADGYIVEGKIPQEFFREIKGFEGSLAGKTIRAGVFRGKKKNSNDAEAFFWYTWLDPHLAEPDFHVPSALGVFQFK